MLKKLRKANIARNEEYAPEHIFSLSFRGNELAGETGEACNVLKKMDRHIHLLPGGKWDRDHLIEELADVIICVDLIAMDLDVDLGPAIKAKFNKTSDKLGLETKL